MRKKSGKRVEVRSLGWSLLMLSIFVPALAWGGEAELRARLGIPAEVKAVLVFAQSSHVDPDWLVKADQYQKLTDKAFDGAWAELNKDPRYVYSVECIFFFKRYWDGHPDRQAALRDYVNQGRIRFTGTGVTTPDTLLPEGENILRDYLIGLSWLKKQGMEISPKLAYLPDDFGHSPSVPTMLRELGYQYAAVGRIDGKYSMAADYWPPGHYPLPGSNAELLYQQLKTLDFVWQAPDGAEVITHVGESGSDYSMGDLIAHGGGVALMGTYLAVPSRSAGRTNQRIDSYIAKLQPLSRTGYMFCSIGGDFNPPVPDLNRILDAYNRMRYPQTGVWAVLAGLEDYMELVSYHRDQLPQLKFDPNPYWTGFYSSRPGLKQQTRQLSRSLLLAETLGVIAQDQGLASSPDLALPWYISAMSNHHDFITGTSRDKVLRQEQLPLLKQAQATVDAAMAERSARLNPPRSVVPLPLKWTLEAGVLKAENSFYEIELDAGAGGCITRWYDRVAGREILAGPSNDVVLYAENGGLYKMGMEVFHGRFQEIGRASNFPAHVSAVEQNGVLQATVESKFKGHSFVRTLFLRSDSPLVRLKIKGSVKRQHTATVSFLPAIAPGRLIMEVPYGVVERPLERLYSPTFWPVKNWVDWLDRSEQFGVNLAVAAPGSVTARPNGVLEAVALRNATMERTMGIPAPQTVVANGTDPDEHEFDFAFWPHGAETWLDRRVFKQAQTALSDSFIAPGRPDPEALAASLVTLDRSDVVVTAVKQAESGDGIIIRLFCYAPGPVRIRLTYTGRPIKSAFRSDALEHELDPLPLTNNRVELNLPYALATVLLRQ